MIESGYDKHCAAYQIMGQNKYVEIVLRQREVLYRDHPFSRLQECRINRVVRRCHRSTGKRCVAVDEHLEHGNRFYSDFPMPRSLSGFCAQSRYVGAGLMCRKFCDTWYTTKFKGNVAADYTKNVAPCMTPEKKLVYQVFNLLETHKDKGRGQPTVEYVLSVEKKLTGELRREVLERAMKGAPETDVDDILASLSQTYQDSIAKVRTVQPSEETGDKNDDGEEGETAEEAAEAEARSSQTEKISKKSVHRLMGEDIFPLGEAELGEKNIIETRKEKARRLEEKCRLRECILNEIHKSGASKPVKKLEHVDRMPSYQRALRKVPNVLGLK